MLPIVVYSCLHRTFNVLVLYYIADSLIGCLRTVPIAAYMEVYTHNEYFTLKYYPLALTCKYAFIRSWIHISFL